MPTKHIRTEHSSEVRLALQNLTDTLQRFPSKPRVTGGQMELPDCLFEDAHVCIRLAQIEPRLCVTNRFFYAIFGRREDGPERVIALVSFELCHLYMPYSSQIN